MTAAKLPLDLDRLVEQISRSGGRGSRVVVAVDGPGASGKSTLAEQVARSLPEAVVVQVDDFYLPSDQRDARSGEGGPLFDLPRLKHQVLEPAARGDGFRYQRYDWDHDAMSAWVEVAPDVPVIVDGVYSLHRSFRFAYTFSVFCRCDRAIRLRRGVDRDGEDAEVMWRDVWMPAEDRYLELEAPDEYADLEVDSTPDGARSGQRFTVVRQPDG